MTALKQRLVLAIPPAVASIMPWLFWTLVCGATCLWALIYMRGWDTGPQTMTVTAFYAAGAALAFWPSAYFARLLSARAGTARLIWLIVLLAIGTIGFTAILFALEFRMYFAQWHGPAFSRIWIWQQFFTAGGAVYTYLVMGLRLYLPAGLIGLLLTSWWLNRLPD